MDLANFTEFKFALSFFSQTSFLLNKDILRIFSLILENNEWQSFVSKETKTGSIFITVHNWWERGGSSPLFSWLKLSGYIHNRVVFIECRCRVFNMPGNRFMSPYMMGDVILLELNTSKYDGRENVQMTSCKDLFIYISWQSKVSFLIWTQSTLLKIRHYVLQHPFDRWDS